MVFSRFNVQFTCFYNNRIFLSVDAAYLSFCNTNIPKIFILTQCMLFAFNFVCNLMSTQHSMIKALFNTVAANVLR